MSNFLIDKEFLKSLDYSDNKQMYAKITSLDINELPKEQIIGKVTGGSVNLDGTSAVRRSCSLTLVADLNDNIITDIYWCFNTLFKLEIGLKNNINKKYEDILWFNMGIYVIDSFSNNLSANSLSISISGKDKMCRLNGEISGQIPMQVDFGTEEVIQSADSSVTWEETDTRLQWLPFGAGPVKTDAKLIWHKFNDVKMILLNKIPIKSIIRNALKEYAQEREENIIINDLDENAWELWEYRGDEPLYFIINKETKQIENMILDSSTQIIVEGEPSIISKVPQYYSMNTLDPTYNKKATVVSMGDKEYYIAKIEYGDTAGYHQIKLVYNNDLILNASETVTALLDKIKNMLGEYEYFYDLKGRFVFQKKQTYMKELFSPIDGHITNPTITVSPYSYEFKDKSLFTAISSPPNLKNLKNDFAVWGSKKTASGAAVPFHVRYAIHKKPISYKSFDQEDFTIEKYDWREIIYRMAKDFYKHNQETDYLIQLEKNNPQYIGGKTGYEQYYSDLQAFWRQLYNPAPTSEDLDQYGDFYKDQETGNYWNKKIHTDPNSLFFWFDFFDTDGDLSKYSIDKIGSRTKIVNESTINSIYYKEVPEVQFIISSLDNIAQDTVNQPIWISEEMMDLFSRSAQGISAIAKTNELINTHAAIIEGLNITSIPIFYLQPNTRIYVEGYGDYTVDKITFSLNYNGTMNLTGTKIINQLF